MISGDVGGLWSSALHFVGRMLADKRIPFHKLMVGAVLCAPAFASAGVVDRVAAVVGQDVVTLSEVYDLGGPFIEQKCQASLDPTCGGKAELEVLDALIQRALMRQELQRLELTISAEDIDRGVDAMARQYGLADREQLRTQVQAEGLEWETFREQVHEQLQQMKFIENVIRPRITVTKNEIVDLYQRAARDYSGPAAAELEAFALTIPEDLDEAGRVAMFERAMAVVEDLNGGRREWLATIKELDSGTYAPRDGKMGTFKKGELNPSFDAMVFSTPVGQVGRPLQVGNALLIVKVVALREADVKPLEEIEAQLREQVFEAKTEEAVAQWYQQALRKASVKILLEKTGEP